MNPRNSLSVATLILGLTAFIPIAGLITGPIAIVIGIVSLVQIKNRQETGAGITTAGLISAVIGLVAWGLIWGFMSNQLDSAEQNGTFDELKTDGTRRTLNTVVGHLEAEKKREAAYPETLEFLKVDKFITTTDFYGNDFYYQLVTEDSFELRSSGKDGVVFTEDDILP
jgi:hypothetical protein